MGYLVEKYNKAYFLRKDIEGNPLPYGVEGIENFLKGELREHDQDILSRVQFSGANVLEFGFGRGETIKYIWEQGAGSYIGVDFSEAACDIAEEFLQKFSIVGPKIVCSDAVRFIRKFAHDSSLNKYPAIDVVVMLDFVEHIPRSELKEVLKTLKPLLSPKAVVVINTPDFPFDNDVIAEGLNEKGKDSSDFVEETKGMHCNRYTLNSLKTFFSGLGYQPISRGHYFVLPTGNETVWSGDQCYRTCWNAAITRGIPLLGSWIVENFELAYEVSEKAKLYQFREGNLNGMSLYVVPSYLEYYSDGDYDSFLIKFVAKYNLVGKTIFDLGAFVGVNSMQFARLVGSEGTVCAFEPNPYNLDRLKLNISENAELSDSIKIFPFAVSNEKGNAKFNMHRNIDKGFSSASYLQGAYTTMSEQQLSELDFTDVSVEIVALDEFVHNSNFIPACIKIDVEGAEHLVLMGAINTLKQYHPILLIELHSILCAVASVKILIPLGYKIELLHLEPDGRCFVGATFVESETQLITDSLQVQQNDILTELEKLDLVTTKAKLHTKTQAYQRLIAELNQMRSLCDNLNSQLEDHSLIIQNQNLQLEQQAVFNNNLSLQQEQQCSDINILQTLNKNLNLELEQLRATNETLSKSLLRYQMFPLIRMLRKLRRIFN